MENNDLKSSLKSTLNDLIMPGVENYEIIRIVCDKMMETAEDNRIISTEKKLENNSIIESIPIMNSSSKLEESLFKSVIIFKSKENQISINTQTVMDACPAIQSSLKDCMTKDITITLPEWITSKNVNEYFIYYNDDSYSDFSISVRKLLMICDYFGNQVLINKVIMNEIIPYLNKDNSLLFLEDSYLKLNKNADNPAWFDLFYTSLLSVAKNLIFYLENAYEKIKTVNKKILEEIIEKYFQIIHNSDTICLSSSALKLVISLVFYIRGSDNVYELLINELYRINSSECIEELSGIKPSFKVSLTNDIKHLYKEYPYINIEKQQFTFILYYKKSDNSLNISYKLSFPTKFSSNLKILTVLAMTKFKQFPSIDQITTKTISSQKALNNIYSKSDFSSRVSNLNIMNNEIKIRIYLKICYTHSAIQHYYLANFKSFYNDKRISKLTKYNLFSLLQNKYLKKESENQIVISFCNWFLDEKNINEDVLSLIELISWRDVSLDVIFEFIIKFSKIIEKYEIQSFFTEVLENKLNSQSNQILTKDNDNQFKNLNSTIGSTIANALINSSKKVDFVEIYERIFDYHKTSNYNFNTTNMNFSNMPKLRKNHSQMDSFNFKITPKNYFSENDQIFNSENSYRENNKSFRRKLKIYTENETNTIKSFDSVAKIISPKTLSKELKENEREMVMFQSGFSDISQISKMEAFERKEESKKDSNSNKLLINNKKINKETSREKKNKDSSEASFKINETTRIGKKLNKNHSSNTMNTSRSLVNNFRQNKINYSTNHNSTKNIFQDQKKSLMKSKNEPKAFLDQEINKGVIIDSSLNNIVDSNDLPGLKNTKTKSVNTSTTSSKIKNIPKCMSLLTPSKKTTKLEKGESNNKKVIKKNNSHFLGNKIQDILKHKEEPQYTPYNLKSKFNNPVAINSKKMELSSNYSEKKLEKKEDKSKLITDTIKNFPNLKKTIEKTLKRPLSYNSPKIV